MEWKAMNDDVAQESVFDNWGDPDDEEVPTQAARENDRDAILFMVDCQESMFQANAEGDVPFDVAIQCCMRIYKDKVLSSESDHVGLVLYSTLHKLNAYDFDGIYIFHTLGRPSAQRIKELESLTANREAFKQHVGSKNAFPVSDCLWTAQHLFQGIPKTIGYKRILLFTDDDDPTKGDQASRDRCIARSRDLLEADITLQLFAMRKGLPHQQGSTSPSKDTASGQYVSSVPIKGIAGMSSKGTASVSLTNTGGASLDTARVRSPNPNPAEPSQHSFDAAIFWRDLIYIDDDEFASKAIHLDAKSSFQEMLDPLKRKTHKKRSCGRLKVVMGNQPYTSPAFAVSIFNPCMRAKRGTPIHLDAKTNTLLSCDTLNICHNTAATLAPGDMDKCLDLGATSVRFTNEEVKTMTQQFGEPGLRILGFKSREKMKLTHQVGVPYWLHPDDSSVAGSSKVFKALVLKMTDMEKVGIAELIARKHGAPRLVALLPQLETHEADGSKDECFGIHVIPLPYANDIRELELKAPEAKGEHHDTLVVKAKQIIKRMKLQPAFDGAQPRYDPSDYPNPALQKHFTVLQSIALEEDYEDVPDYTLPDYKSMAGFSDLFSNYRAIAYSQVYDPESSVGTAGMKRTLAEYENSDPKKIDISAIDFEERYEKGTLASCTVVQLRQYCKNNKEDCTGLLKADLVELVRAIVRSKLEALGKGKPPGKVEKDPKAV